LEPFTAASGWVFNTLDLYLEDRHGFMLDAFGDAAASDQLSRARRSSWLALPLEGATRLIESVERIDMNPADLIAFITSEHGPDHAADEAAGVQAALDSLKAWLKQVSPGVTGLLSVG
jgi:hypothetical protein